MFSDESQKTSSVETTGKDRAAEVANVFEWLITGFVLALLFMAFIMQAFRIPTGSMADTLMGDHFRLRCPQCGYKYNHGPPQNYGSRRLLKPIYTRCPSCGYYQPATTVPIAYGDRILVLKCIYQFLDPKRWDVIVFKNPLDPRINYIKRLVGRPGETVEIIDGDVYINGQISRKPPKVQNGLWMPVYDNDYQPVRPKEPAFNGHTWRQPFDTANSEWTIPENNPTKFSLDSPGEKINAMTYDSSIGNDFRATYAYDDVAGFEYLPYCSDLMVRFYVNSTESLGRIGISLSKYETAYSAWVNSFGDMVIEAAEGRETIELARKQIVPFAYNKPTLVKFTNVDHQLIFQVGSEKLTHDLGHLPGDAGPRKTGIQPQVKIFGSGKLTLSHVAIFRDIHYTAKRFPNSPEEGRAIEGTPFTLAENEFFVLGDNSPNSQDGRWWNRLGRANKGLSAYTEGIVPRDYLVGKALFVYWPMGFKLFAKDPLGLIPNIGQLRFIYGGSSR